MNFIILGNILRESRKKAGYTQQDVADLFYMTFSNVSSWERGKSKIDIESYLKLCNFYGIEAIRPLVAATEGIPGYNIALYEVDFEGDEYELIGKYQDLNENGKIKAHDYIDDLVESDRYVENESTIKYWKDKKDGEIEHNDTMANYIASKGKSKRVFIAAKSKDNKGSKIVELSRSAIEKLEKAEDTDEI